jgi:hypothetical protein
MVPMDGSWQAVAASSDVVADGVMHPFEHRSLIGFRAPRRRPARGSVGEFARNRAAGCVRRTGRPAALPVPFDLVLAHRSAAGPSAAGPPTPLPQLQVREDNGTIEVLGPVEPTKPA